MKSLIMIVLSLGIFFSFVGCGSGDTAKIIEENIVVEESAIEKVTQVGPFSDGAYGDVSVTSNYTLPQDAVLIDIRNAWEREVYGGYPEGSLVATYQTREEHAKNVAEDKSKREQSLDFVSDVLNLVGQDKHSQIILICATGSRTGAKGDRDQESAAKYLSSEGFTNVWHLDGGIWGDNGWSDNNLQWIGD